MISFRKFAVRPAAILLAGIAIAGPVLAGCSAGNGYNDVAADTDWRFHGNDTQERRFSDLSQINAGNVGSLGLAWSLDLPDENSLQATPLEVGGVLYFSGGLSAVYAVDAITGRQLWSYDPEVGNAAPEDIRVNFSINRGVGYWQGKVYDATKDGRLIALDARSGKVVWTTRFLDPKDHAISTGAPRILDGKVIIGNSGAEMGVRGFVTTMDAQSGKILWRWYAVPGNPAVDKDETTLRASKTWAGEWWKYGGGGTPWSGITYDPEFNQVLIGTGNGAPYNTSYRCPNGEDNLYLASVVALDVATGRYKWHYQYNPCEAWDWKATSDIVLSTLKVDGKDRKVLMQAPSNGFFYVIDRSNGKLISAEPYGKQNWADRIDLKTGRPVERPGIRYQKNPIDIYPGPYGAHNWQPTSYNPKTGLIYIPYMQNGLRYMQNGAVDMKDLPGRRVMRVGVGMAFADDKDPMNGRGALIALDPVTQKVKWRIDHEVMWNAGLLSTAGDLVFQGSNTGILNAYDARDGKKLWSFDAKLGIIAPPITYARRGKQYISILVGPGGSTGESALPEMRAQGWKYGLQPRRLLTFVLNGKGILPQTPGRDSSLEIPDVPGFVVDGARATAGEDIFARGCSMCHGFFANAAGGAPDLRASPIAADMGSFKTVLHEGVLVSRGMPKFDDLTDDDVKNLYHYIRRQADEEKKSHK